MKKWNSIVYDWCGTILESPLLPDVPPYQHGSRDLECNQLDIEIPEHLFIHTQFLGFGELKQLILTKQWQTVDNMNYRFGCPEEKMTLHIYPDITPGLRYYGWKYLDYECRLVYFIWNKSINFHFLHKGETTKASRTTHQFAKSYRFFYDIIQELLSVNIIEDITCLIVSYLKLMNE